MTSHLWSNGLVGITLGAASAPSYSSWATPAPTWTNIYSTLYTGYWRCGLATGVGTYNSSTYYNANTETTNLSGSGYTALGVRIDGASANSVALGSSDSPVGSHVEYLCTTTPTWTSSTFSAQYPIIFASTGTASSSPVLGHFDLGQSVSVTSGTFTLTFGTDSGRSNSVFNLAVQ